MRFALVTVILTVTTFGAQATTLCQGIGDMAESIMAARQKGSSIQAHLEVLKKIHPSIQPMVEEMIMNAYSVPLFSTQAVKDETIAQFRNDQQLACMKALKKG